MYNSVHVKINYYAYIYKFLFFFFQQSIVQSQSVYSNVNYFIIRALK